MIKLLADENIPDEVCEVLWKEGIDIINVRKISLGVKDKEIIAIATREERAILTFDKDFGELIFKQKIPVKGIILLRFSPKSSKFILEKVKMLLMSKDIIIENNFLVVEEDKIRVRKL